MIETLENIPSEPGVKKPDPICRIQKLKHSFGGLVAVDVQHLEIQRGTITAIIGPNGAGKTTLFNILTGFQSPDFGTWSLDGEALEKKRAHEIARAGMVRTFQLTKTLDRLSVLESLLLASQLQKGEQLRHALFSSWRKQAAKDEERALHLLQEYGLYEMRDHYTSTLSGGQRKLLEISRALMCDPKLILLDEPVAGVNPALVEYILEHIKRLLDLNKTLVFVEHNMDAVVGASDWVVCLSEGHVIAEGKPNNLIQNQAVIDAYLGS